MAAQVKFGQIVWAEIADANGIRKSRPAIVVTTNDRIVWRFAQEHKMVLLTDNRNMKGQHSLEQVIREETSASSLPVITIGDPDRLSEKPYREQCVTRLIDILINLKNYLATGRLFIP
jgi:hypothetical protein